MFVHGIDIAEASLKTVLKTGSKGRAVEDLQNLLKANGFTQAGPTDGEFGPSTKRALVQFQQSHNLDVDGLAGVNVWLALTAEQVPAVKLDAPITGSARAVELLSIASKEIGVHEEPDGSNGGPRVDVYTGKWRVSWCSLFVSWVIRQTSWSPWSKPIAAVMIARSWAQDKRLYRSETTYEPQPGDLFVMVSKGGDGVDTGHGHIGFVLSYDPVNKAIRTIEGNSSNAVRSQKRPCSSIEGYIKICDVA